MRRFNVAGPCLEDRHYMVPPEPRLPEARPLIEEGAYFVVHAPRQTGKTTTLRALARALTAEGRFAALHFSCEMGEPHGENIGAAEAVVLSEMRAQAQALPEDLRPPAPVAAEPGTRLAVELARWAAACPRPLVLFFDEIDALRGESLRTVLRQLRARYHERPAGYPASVILCGLRDVRDYKAASGGDASRLGTSSPFNVKLKSLRLGSFSLDDVRLLLGQHTAETGQPLGEAALDHLVALTGGQPWLVNALAREVVVEMKVAPPQPITVAHLEEAKERLILARATHLDSLVARLHEPRVHRVLEPILAGTVEPIAVDGYDDDVQYVVDLGLLAPGPPLQMANPIYREVIVRVLALGLERQLDLDPRSFVRDDGRLDLRRLLEEFAAFWREHADVLTSGSYREVAPQLVLMAFLHRVVNGGGYVDREYGVGRGRIDLLVRWPVAGGQREWQREALELKVWRDRRPDPLPQGLAQLDGYLERLGLDHGVLLVFDRRADAPPLAERVVFSEARTPAGRSAVVLRA
jgi:DNA polymerase III delta prime subunit